MYFLLPDAHRWLIPQNLMVSHFKKQKGELEYENQAPSHFAHGTQGLTLIILFY